ncbi:MAG: DUF1684 domain-containing protein [Bacteroidia bacterium]|nr:DUF1684 domain-containing protein [Bacteroidia bacterium]MBT8278234.1 DUF1684 domain-containing protein [Bacteroidia bacterium]NND24688.1 DUF1684 domain-containing protein [Flavobacteriaceae bacterium]NNK59030.1 DUF1684 domain-containing protein [Flavobacteriaceae bacterium]NNL33824.1 DUF1684 domain-containing protein [Flavobacteriaceae bacterium]
MRKILTCHKTNAFMIRAVILILLTMMLISCKHEESQIPLDDDYKTEIETYKGELLENRKNYLQLRGLFPLKIGENTFGRSATNTMVLDIEELPEIIGTFSLSNNSIQFNAADSADVFTKDELPLKSNSMMLDSISEAPRLYFNRINWQVILRSGRYYLRVWDTENPMIAAFKGFESYDLNPNFIITGAFKYFEEEKTEEVHSQLGVNASTKFIGQVTFNYDGETHQLDVGNSGFTMVRDLTTGDETYGGGRYIYLDLPETDGEVHIDFNKLYNPPCSFSKFTTCLYPPQQNNLPFKLEAGEKIAIKE